MRTCESASDSRDEVDRSGFSSRYSLEEVKK